MNILKTYLNDNKFKLNITNKSIYIDNFKTLRTLEENLILLVFEDFNLTIKGNNFTVSKLTDNEILFTGEIKNITFE
jgi:sporulation protein YqfC